MPRQDLALRNDVPRINTPKLRAYADEFTKSASVCDACRIKGL